MNNSASNLPVSVFIEIGMTNSGTRFNNRNRCIFSYKIDEAATASRNYQIDIFPGI